MNTFCTIITTSHLPFARVLYKSLQRHHSNIAFNVLTVDENHDVKDEIFSIHKLDDIASTKIASEIIEKYNNIDPDFLRWALKPVFISFLLNKGNEKVIFLDPDLYFTNDFDFLWELLEGNSILLSPHNNETTPFPYHENFSMSFQIGIFNAGLVGATHSGLAPLHYWAECCLFYMTRDKTSGFFVDQKYLDLLPVLFDRIKILTHKGCNLGSWNITNCPRTLNNGAVTINNNYPVVFIHFNHETIRQILVGNDNLLRPYYNQYEKLLLDEGVKLDNIVAGLTDLKKTNLLVDLKRKTKIKTRIKRFLFRLSQKL